VVFSFGLVDQAPHKSVLLNKMRSENTCWCDMPYDNRDKPLIEFQVCSMLVSSFPLLCDLLRYHSDN